MVLLECLVKKKSRGRVSLIRRRGKAGEMYLITLKTLMGSFCQENKTVTIYQLEFRHL